MREGYHTCPKCEMKFGQINDYYNHIEGCICCGDEPFNTKEK